MPAAMVLIDASRNEDGYIIATARENGTGEAICFELAAT
jgi:hypothetical protein